MDAALRFPHSLHKADECGKNSSGFSAITSASKYSNLHSLDNYPCYSTFSHQQSKHMRKKSLTSQDTAVYLLTKSFSSMPPNSTYILVFSRKTCFCLTLRTLMTDISDLGNIVLCLRPSESEQDKYTVDMFYLGEYFMFGDFTFSVTVDIANHLTSNKSVISIVYPSPTQESIDLVNTICPKIWLVLASPESLYISSNDEHSSFAFPWSKPGCYVGYTIGTGQIISARWKDEYKFRAAFGFYDSMISGMPIGNSCSDCMEMNHVATLLYQLRNSNFDGETIVSNEDTVIALDEINEMIKQSVI